MSRFALAGALAVALFNGQSVAQDDSNPCVSYGVDFQQGGTYFQNVTSTDAFSFVSFFEGCQADTCTNILVDPSGDEYLCSDTELTPDDTNQLSTCPIDKDALYSGAWSVILISNNGDAEPIAYERDFNLVVGTPVTSTVTPTVTVTINTTPLVSATVTTTSTTTTTVTTTTTQAKVTRKPTITITPAKVKVTVTSTIGTVTKPTYVVHPVLVTSTKLEKCTLPAPQPSADPTCSITPTLVSAAALATTTDASAATLAATTDASANNRRRDNMQRVSSDREARIAERKERLAAAQPMVKRDVDSATVTVTDTNTADFTTTTSTSTAPATTAVFTTELDVTVTATSTATVMSGTTTLSQVTVTAPTPTKTSTHYTLATSYTTITRSPIVVITTHWAPAQSTLVCNAKGGYLA